MDGHEKHIFDILSWITSFGTFFGWMAGVFIGALPAIAAAISAAWGLIRIYETTTVQSFLAKRRKKKNDQL